MKAGLADGAETIVFTSTRDLNWRIIKQDVGGFSTAAESLKNFIRELRRGLGLTCRCTT